MSCLRFSVQGEFAYCLIVRHQNGLKLGEMVMCESGHYVWFIDDNIKGAWDAAILRDLANALDGINRKVDQQIAEYFAQHESE
jgi:hypothetical protein